MPSPCQSRTLERLPTVEQTGANRRVQGAQRLTFPLARANTAKYRLARAPRVSIAIGIEPSALGWSGGTVSWQRLSGFMMNYTDASKTSMICSASVEAPIGPSSILGKLASSSPWVCTPIMPKSDDSVGEIRESSTWHTTVRTLGRRR